MSTDVTSSTGIVPAPGDLATMAPSLRHEFDYPGKTGIFQVYSVNGHPLVTTATYKLVIAKSPSGQLGLAMLAATAENNSAVDRQARVLKTVQTIASVEDASAKSREMTPPFYGAMVPVVLETFTTEEGRLGVFMGYHEVISSYKQLIPLSVATATQRVDLKSAAWMMGKLLKLLGFVHALDFTIGFIDGSNIFIETAQHGVFVLDFTNANEEPTEAEQQQEVMAGIRAIWMAAGGTETADPPHDSGIMTAEQHAQFVSFMRELMAGKTEANQAHDEAYVMYNSIWPPKPKTDEWGHAPAVRDFHLYVTYPR